jgi:hypothetical protein
MANDVLIGWKINVWDLLPPKCQTSNPHAQGTSSGDPVNMPLNVSMRSSRTAFLRWSKIGCFWSENAGFTLFSSSAASYSLNIRNPINFTELFPETL